uniref:PTP-H n=1 Tax=Cotesia sesamiae Mombasa bracovirus TaxID=452649 RepID=R9XKK4_9VIRU|nr:PTP-H [Cotesia sesamiae Mombasa bracovirus]
MATTFDDFWSMIWQENSRIIVMLNGTKQELQPPSPQYFCMTQDHAILKEFIIKEESIRMESHYMYTQLIIVHISSGESRMIHHFKYFDWIETGVPDVGSFLELLLIVNKQDQYYFKQSLLAKQFLPGPIVVHSNLETVSVPLMVLKARQQRRSSISTLNHYMFLNSIIAFFLVAIRSNPVIFLELRSHLSILDAFLLSLDFNRTV